MSLPPGFRFHPTDVELIMYYLKRKVLGKKFPVEAISEINIYKFSPWDLPDKSCLKSKDLEWYFFCPRERKYATGGRMNRATETGYWKTTGKDRAILYNEKNVGLVKTLVFHRGPPPRGERTDWVIHEYRIQDKQLADEGIVQDSYVLCKVFQKNGPGPKNGAQYGAPFKEEEWDDGIQDCNETLSFGGPSAGGATSALTLPEIPSCSVLTSISYPETASAQSLPTPGLTSAEASTNIVLPDVPDDDILHMFASFTENSTIPAADIANNEMLGDNNHERNFAALPCSDANDFYHDLGELANWPELGDSGISLSAIGEADYVLDSMPYPDAYLELNDLEMPLNSSVVANGSEHLPTSNVNDTYNSDNNLGGLYQGVNHYGMNQYSSGLSPLPSLPEGFTVGFTDMLQATGDGSYTNQVYNAYNAAYDFSFTEPDVNRGSDRGVSNGTACSMAFTEPVVYRGINQGQERSGFQNFR